jgi:hypothetical protein
MNCRDTQTLRDLLDMATTICAMQRQINELRAELQVSRMAEPKRASIGMRVTGFLSALTSFFETKLGQALLAIGTPIMVAVIKWLMGNS